MTAIGTSTPRSVEKSVGAVAATDELSSEREWQVLLTVDQYHQMIESGILAEGEPIELLDGFLVRKDRSAFGEDPMRVGPDHSLTVKKLARLDHSQPMAGRGRYAETTTLMPGKLVEFRVGKPTSAAKARLAVSVKSLLP